MKKQEIRRKSANCSALFHAAFVPIGTNAKKGMVINMSYKIKKTEGRARRGTMETVHGVIETPVFMNVGTSAAVKGGISTFDLCEIGCQVELSNTYHLHIRPGDGLIRDLGGIHKFFNWDKPVLTDSGGFQVFSLAKLRSIKEEGVYFSSHIDGKKIFTAPGRRRTPLSPRYRGFPDNRREYPAAYHGRYQC